MQPAAFPAFSVSAMPAPLTGFATARLAMIESQLRPNQVRDPALLAAIGSVPREAFLPAGLSGVAYLDESVAVAPGRYLMQPMVLARLLQAAAVKPGDRVLDIAPGTGYSTAILAAMGARVVAVEPDAALHREAEANLRSFGSGAVEILAGAPVEGCAAKGPFDVILINGSVDFVPDYLLSQLAGGGCLLCVVRLYGPSRAAHTGQARLYRQNDGAARITTLFDANLPLAPDFAAPPTFSF